MRQHKPLRNFLDYLDVNTWPEANLATWTGKDTLKQLREHFASDRFMDDIEAVATEDELQSMTFDSLVERLREKIQANSK